MADVKKTQPAPKGDAKENPANKRRRKKTNRFQIDVKSMLVEGEQIVEQGVIHNGIYWKACAVLLFAFLIAVFLVVQIGVLLAVVSILMFTHATLKKEILLFVLTDKRVFVRYGILQVDVVDIRFSKIESVELERMIPGYIMGYSNLVIMGTGNRYIVIPYIANGIEIRRSYNRLTLADEED